MPYQTYWPPLSHKPADQTTSVVPICPPEAILAWNSTI